MRQDSARPLPSGHSPRPPPSPRTLPSPRPLFPLLPALCPLPAHQVALRLHFVARHDSEVRCAVIPGVQRGAHVAGLRDGGEARADVQQLPGVRVLELQGGGFGFVFTWERTEGSEAAFDGVARLPQAESCYAHVL